VAALTSALHELEGGAATDAGPLKAAGRLRAFLATAASKIADKSLNAAIAAGQTYLQQRFGL